MLRPCARLSALLLPLLIGASALAGEAKTIARCGDGFLEQVDGRRILHLKGSPYQMGFQQGALLKEDIHQLVRFLFDVKAKEAKLELFGKRIDPKKIIGFIVALERNDVPKRFLEELKGVADGSGVSLEEIELANFIPELFHCSGFALSGSATRDGKLYHGRILDYGCDWRLQEHAVLTIAEPVGKIPFVNVTYAGFIGSVTGMNAHGIAIGEMGGKGLGHWAGVPMPFLVRMALEEGSDLDQAIAIFRDHPRTCQYFYVISDGKSGKAVGMEASWDVFSLIQMGESEKRLTYAIPDAVVLSAGDRYEELARRVKAGHGSFDATSSRALMELPVAMKSNLHSVLFEPAATKLWVANASIEGEPAVTQPYVEFQLSELLTHHPDPSVKSIEIKTSRSVETKKIDLRTESGVKEVKGTWRYSDVKIVEVPSKGPDGKPNRTYNIEPKAFGSEFDDSGWEILDPKTLGGRRSTGLVCFNWYRIKITLPEGVEGKSVRFVTTVDDYGEVWVDGKLPRKGGDTGGSVIAGFNVPNRVELKDPRPGKVYQIAVFGINGPISAAPTNYIFLADTYLEIQDK